MTDDDNTGQTSRRIQVCFFFNAQRHQLLHGIATAVELARRPGFDVYVVSPSQAHVEYAQMAAERLGGAPITFVHTRSRLLDKAMRRTGSVVPPKTLTLIVLARWLNRFDAICLPERTSILLKRIGVRRPRFIHLDHGAGDRAAGFDERIRKFDFVLMAGAKHKARLMAERLVRPDNHAVVGYPKFEAADAIRDPDWYPFAQRRPVVLYNPHFSSLGSWDACGRQVLEAFAAQDRYNLLVAPHVRLLDSSKAREQYGAMLDHFDAMPHIHVDRGSDRSIDMTHTTLADCYLGDVSSQIYEFLRHPRPCLFLNPHGVDWAQDENYAHWHYGPVHSDAQGLRAAVDAAFASHGAFVAVQTDGMAHTFGTGGGAAVASHAIADYLEREIVRKPARRWRGGGASDAVLSGKGRKLRRAAALITLLTLGWLLGEGIRSTASSAATEPFLERVVASHRTTVLRADMRRQLAARVYDRREIDAVTGITMPALPKEWQASDIQLYPSTYGHIVHVSVRTPQGEAVSLVGMRLDTDADRSPLLQDRQTERVAYWESADCAFALVGELSSARLLALASQISRR